MSLSVVEKLNELADTISNSTMLGGGSYTLAIRSFSHLVDLVATSHVVSQSYDIAGTHILVGELFGKYSYKVQKADGYGYGPGEFDAEILIEAYAYAGRHDASIKVSLHGPKNNDDITKVEIIEVCRLENFEHQLSKCVELWAFRHYLKLSKLSEKLAS